MDMTWLWSAAKRTWIAARRVRVRELRVDGRGDPHAHMPDDQTHLRMDTAIGR